MLSPLQQRVRNRRLGSRRYTLFSSLDSSAFAQVTLGCVLVLLIVFMMYAPQHGNYVFDPYTTRHATLMPDALRDNALRVIVTRDGSVYFGNGRIALEDLAEQVRQRLRGGAQNKIFLVVDQRARFGDFSPVLDEVRHAGIRNIAFLAENPVMHR
jgi:biopolymer transport protein ExbD